MRFELPHEDPNNDDDREASASSRPELEPIFRTRRARIAASAGMAALCIAFCVYQGVYALPDATVPGIIVSPDNKPIKARDITSGDNITLPPGTEIDVICKTKEHGYEFGIESGEYDGYAADSVPRANLFATQDPFSADHAPGGAQDRLEPLRGC